MLIKPICSNNNIKKQSYDYELIAQAYHEAGHAFMALHNFMKVFNVNVMDGRDQDGNTEYLSYEEDAIKDDDLRKMLLIFELQTSYAGLVAEKIYYKDICGSDKFPMHLRIGSSKDIQDASRTIKKYNLVKPGKSRIIFKKQIQDDIGELIIEHWDAIKVIAHSLYVRRKLDFSDLKFLLTRKTEHNSFWKERFKKIIYIHKDNNDVAEKEVKEIMLEGSLFVL